MPCGPGRSPVIAGACRQCARQAVRTNSAVLPLKERLKSHMAGLGVQVDTPTRIYLVSPDRLVVDEASGTHGLGTTTWNVLGRRLSGTITIRMQRDLPVFVFRHVLAHEFAHAALAGGPGLSAVPPALHEGFAEALAIVHVRAADTGGASAGYLAAVLANPDPVYGDGLRAVLPVIESLGLPRVLSALRAGKVRDLKR